MPHSTSRANSVDRAINDFDAAIADFRQDLPLNNNNPSAAHQPFTTTTTTNDPSGADPDAEIRIRKKRAPAVKLDENLLLSPAGIPRLRRIANSSKTKFKGKGHEFSDVSKLLSTYQFWLDDLYPKAKFRDGLKMVEKVGHGRRMQVMRRGWVDGCKAGAQGREGSLERVGENEGAEQRGEGDEEVGARGGVTQERDSGMPDDDDLDALMAEAEADGPVARPFAPVRRSGPFEEDDGAPDEDELDALMAEAQAPTTKPAPRPAASFAPFEEDDAFDDDDLDALMAEQEVTPKAAVPAKPTLPFEEDDEPDEDELDALMAEQNEASKTTAQEPPPDSSQPTSIGREIEEDELDALMDEQDAAAS